VSAYGMAKTASRWRSRLALLDWWHDRLTRVQIDCRDALEVIRYWDSPDTVFYVDPPYVPGTRVDKAVYKHECSDEYHVKLVDVLLEIKGQAAVSGYDHPIYRHLEDAGWERHERVTVAHAAARIRGSKLRGQGAAKQHARRVEVLWVRRTRG
ncbi:MAG: DNA adenine methylase, partial [Mariprofundales bacterium]|nr:DNA adenine methylase [Mariprofundales bacterium]